MKCFLALVVMLFVGCDSSYESDSSDYYNSGTQNTSESHRRDVTDKMIEQGSDPTEAEAFTSELFKAQREWEANK